MFLFHIDVSVSASVSLFFSVSLYPLTSPFLPPSLPAPSISLSVKSINRINISLGEGFKKFYFEGREQLG